MQRSKFTLLLTLVGILILTVGTNPVYADESLPLQEETGEVKADTTYNIAPLTVEGPNRFGAREVYQGDNPAQALDILFSQYGFNVQDKNAQNWQWTLRMLGYGYGDAQVSFGSANAVIERNRIEFHRGNLVEWYINSEEGVEQGFTIQNAPAGRQAGVPLVVSMALNSDLTPNLSNDNQSIDFYGVSVLPVLRYAKLVVTDANGKLVPSYFMTEQNTINIVIDDSQAVYPLTIDPLLTNLINKIFAEDGQANDLFGHVVHTSGSGNGGPTPSTAVVGAPDDDGSKGSVYVYGLNSNSTAWVQQDKITASDAAANDEFGDSAFVTGGSVIIVGAPKNGGGAAYVYERNAISPTQWVEIDKITPTVSTAGDEFGAAVSADTNTSVDDIVVAVGTPGDSSGKGAVYVYVRDPITRTQFNLAKKLTPSDGAAGDAYGSAVYVSEISSGGGVVTTIYVGALDHNGERGAVYVYQRDEGGADNWGEVAKLEASDGAAGDKFGASISYSNNRVMIGAPRKNNRTGGVYVFETAGWTEQKIVEASESQVGEEFGGSVGLSGNFAIVGARRYDTNPSQNDFIGKAYYLYRGSNKWDTLAELFPPVEQPQMSFGQSVAIRGSNVIVSAFKDDDPNGDNAGSAYVYNVPTKVGFITAIVDVQPDDASTEWNVAIDGIISTDETFMGDGGIMTQTMVTGVYSVTLSAGAGTSLDGYTVTSECSVNGGTPVVGGTVASVELVNPGQTKDFATCVFTLSLPGTIQIAKVTDPADSTESFSFASSLATSGSFSLTNGMTETFSSLVPGTYEVTESIPPGWVLQNLVCNDSASTIPSSIDLGTAKATISVEAGETVTCTYTNQQLSTINIKNITVPAGGLGYVFNNTIDSVTFVLNDGETKTFSNVPSGQYQVSKLTTGEPPLAAIACDDTGSATPSTFDLPSKTATINAEPGETVTCTFTHADDLPEVGTINIVKATDPAGGAGFAFTDNIPGSGSFSLDDGDGGKTFVNVPIGTYTVSETAKNGWDLTDLTCVDPTSDSSKSGSTATIVLAAGETVTCTFTNTEQAPEPGTIVIKKLTNPTGGTGFAFTHTIPGAGGFSLNDGGTKTFTDVEAGTYSITESAKDGWELNGITCDDNDSITDKPGATATIVVAAGEVVTCTFTNSEQGVSVGRIIIDKLTSPATGTGFAFTDNIPGSSGSFSLDHGGSEEFSDIAPGTYSVTEASKDGWTLNTVLCTDADGGSTASGATATIELDAGETVRCVFQSQESLSSSPAVELTTTVGTVSGICATTSTIEVEAGTTVYYCYSAKNTGDVALTIHSLVDDQLGTIFSDVSSTLEVGATITNIALAKAATAEITAETTNEAEWTAKENASTPQVGAKSSATVKIKAPVDTGVKIYLSNIYK